MRSRSERIQDRASFLTPPYEEPAVLLAHAIVELCHTVDDASERIAEAQGETRRAIDQLSDDLGKHLKQSALAR
jgi:hypothetical protein